MLRTLDDKYLKKLDAYFHKNKRNFTGKLYFEYFTGKEGYLSLKSKDEKLPGKKKYSLMLFEMHDFLFNRSQLYKSHIIEHEGGLPFDFFAAVVDNSIFLKKYKWTIHFIKKNIRYADPSIEDNLFALCMAKLYFAKKDYDEALLYLNKIKSKGSEFYKSYKFLLTQVFYEQNNFESVEVNLMALKKYAVRNKKLPPYVKVQIYLFIKYFKKLLNIKTMGEKNKYSKVVSLRKSLEMEEKGYYLTSWFYEKLDEM